MTDFNESPRPPKPRKKRKKVGLAETSLTAGAPKPPKPGKKGEEIVDMSASVEVGRTAPDTLPRDGGPLDDTMHEHEQQALSRDEETAAERAESALEGAEARARAEALVIGTTLTPIEEGEWAKDETTVGMPMPREAGPDDQTESFPSAQERTLEETPTILDRRDDEPLPVTVEGWEEELADASVEEVQAVEDDVPTVEDPVYAEAQRALREEAEEIHDALWEAGIDMPWKEIILAIVLVAGGEVSESYRKMEAAAPEAVARAKEKVKTIKADQVATLKKAAKDTARAAGVVGMFAGISLFGDMFTGMSKGFREFSKANLEGIPLVGWLLKKYRERTEAFEKRKQTPEKK